MATTNATISISSADIVSDVFSLVKTMSLTSDGTTGLTQTTGLNRLNNISTSAGTTIAASGSYSGSYNWLFISNLDSTFTNFITVRVGAQAIGRIPGGTSALIPWSAAADLSILAVSASTTVEYCLFNAG